jgi:SLT domain-containing protein
MQTIPPTFNAYALPGHGDIHNPVDNIIAGVRYALARYGSPDNVPGVAAVRNGQPYVGY